MTLINRFNQLLNKIGVDKILHRLVGSDVTNYIIIAALILFPPITIPVFFQHVVPITGLVTMALAVAKEIIDDKYDWRDIFATLRGWLISIIIVTILLLIA